MSGWKELIDIKDMLNVLINAYAVAPNYGSEQGLTWMWITELAKYHNLYVITEGEWQTEIEQAVMTHPLKDRMHFYFNPVSPKVRRMCWNQGDWRFYIHYRRWQEKTLKIAKQICSEVHIDITHQLSMIGFREPGLLWKIVGPKHLWGPIGSMGDIPTRFLTDLPLHIRLKQMLKNTISHYQITHSPVREAVKNSDRMIAALKVTADIIKEKYGVSVDVISETGLLPGDEHLHEYDSRRPLELLWVGRFIPTKKLSIAFESLARTKDYRKFRLHIVGAGSDEEVKMYHSLAEKLGINDVCIWYGRIPHAEVQIMMQKKDLFFFTSVYEGGPHVVNEAIANNLPILCFDTCGQGLVVDDSIGWKVPLSTLDDGIKQFAEKLDFIQEHRELLSICSNNCTAKQQELSWERKIRRISEIYEELVNGGSVSMR